MGFGFRIYFIDEDDKITRIPLTRFERIRDRDPKESHSEYQNSLIRYAKGRVAISMMPSIPLPGEPENVINASDRFAQKRFKDEFTWTPSFELEQEIIKKSFE